jgi:hypothetical protein
MEIMLKKQKERQVESSKETAFILRGRPVDQAKIDRYKKDHATELGENSDVDIDINPSPKRTFNISLSKVLWIALTLSIATPADIKYYTPADTSSTLSQHSSSPTTETPPQVMEIPKSQRDAPPALPPRPEAWHYQAPPPQHTFQYSQVS